MLAVVAYSLSCRKQEAAVTDGAEFLVRGVIASVYVCVSALYKEDFHREGFACVGSSYSGLEAVPSAVGERQGLALVVFHFLEGYPLADNLKLGLEFVSDLAEGIPAEVVVVAYELLHVLDAVSDRPSGVSPVHVVHKHLKVFIRLGCEWEFEPTVHRIPKLPYLGFVLLA